jgi:serine/threonine protein kinase/tetratricopeptide (TPR) repeat protein
MTLSAGDKLGPYEIIAALGAGGMGEVYKARDARLDREVAVKVLPAHLSTDPQALARFVREHKALAALSHPNILAIFDAGTEQGASYAVTELLEGETLRSLLARGALGWRKAVEIGIALAEGLAAAHSKSIVHRDLTPANIFLTGDGRAKILDFGLARLEQLDGEDAATRTEPGAVMGTPGYMSPEQVLGQQAGPASDIFSLGCVVFEMVSGQRAFPGRTLAETMASILNDTPSNLAAVGVQVPGELDRLVAHCLQKNPQKRCQSARDLAFHLKAVVTSDAGTRVSVAASKSVDSIAVLPFANASADPDTEYLCDGITESILNALARIGRLRITPRSTVFRYKAQDPDALVVGRELDVRLVLTGRVIQRGETLVVGAELADVATGTQLWGERYNRKLSDIFKLEEEIARKISESLRKKLTGEEMTRLTKRFTDNSEAYRVYLRGRHHWIRRTPNHLKKSVEYFQQAIAKDPAYALAYSGLADCHSILTLFSVVPSKDGLARAKAAAAAAVALDPDLAEGHTSLAFIRAYFDYDWTAADKEFQCALQINPNYWVAPYWSSFSMMSRAREQEAEQQVRHALELEPSSPAVLHAAALISVMARRYDQAVERCLRGLEYDPGYFHLRLWLGLAYQCQEKYAEAIAEFERAYDLSEGMAMTVGALGNAQAVAGNCHEASRSLQQLFDESERKQTSYYQVALIHAGLGDDESALLYLENGCEAREAFLPMMVKVDPRFRRLRSEVRYQKVLERLRLV